MKNELHKTADINEASILNCFKHPVGIELDNKSEKQKFIFIFECEENTQEISDSFWEGSLSINVKEFLDSQRFIRDLLFREKKKINGG
jgi:hypothetical protein